MARSVSLTDEAFRVLRSEKRPGESDSDVLLRLAREARRTRKDPTAFLENPPRRRWSREEYDAFRERMRTADVEKARQEYGEGPREERTAGDLDSPPPHPRLEDLAGSLSKWGPVEAVKEDLDRSRDED